MGLHHLKTVPILYLWLLNCRIGGGNATVRSTTIPEITSTISSAIQTIIETGTSAGVAARNLRKNNGTTVEDTSSTHLSSYVRDTSTAVFVEKRITENPEHFPSFPDETTDEMTVTAGTSATRNSLLTSLPSTRSPPEMTAAMTNPIGTPEEKLLTSRTTSFTSLLSLEATSPAGTLVAGTPDDSASSVDIISPTSPSSYTQDKTTFQKTERVLDYFRLMHTVTAAQTIANTHTGTEETLSLPRSAVSNIGAASAFSTIIEDILTSFHSTRLPFETRTPAGILEDTDTAHTSKEVAAGTIGVTDAPVSSLSTGSASEMPSAFITTMEPISTVSPSVTSPFETTATTSILADRDAARTSGEAATTADITATMSSFTTSNAVELPSTFRTTTEVISAPSSHSTMSSPGTTATTSFFADQVTTGTSSEVGPSTMGDTTAAVSSFNSSSVETPSIFSTTAETTPTALSSIRSPLETTATAGILADENTTGPSKRMTSTTGFLFTSSTVETQFTSRFATDATTDLLSMVSPSKPTATAGIITDANTTHASGETTASTEGGMAASISSIPAKQSSAALFSPAEISPTPGTSGKTIPPTHPSTFMNEASSAFSPTAEAIGTDFPPTIALTEMAATTGIADTSRFSTSNLEKVASTPAEMSTTTISTIVDESSPAQLFSLPPDKVAAETGSPTTEDLIVFSQTAIATSSFPQMETTGKIATTAGISTAETTPPFVLSSIPSERTKSFSISAEDDLQSNPVPSTSLPETRAIFAAGTSKVGATSPAEEIPTIISTVVEGIPPAIWSSPAQTEKNSISAITEETTTPASLPYTSPDQTLSNLGPTSEATSTAFTPPMSPVEITTKASIATDIGTESIGTTEGKTTSELPSASTSLGGRTVRAKLSTPSGTTTSLPNSKLPSAHDLGRIRFILSMSLTTSLNITDPAVRDAVVKKFHQDLHARFPDAGFSVTWLEQQQES